MSLLARKRFARIDGISNSNIHIKVDKYIYPDLDPIQYYPSSHAVDPRNWQDDAGHFFWLVLISVVATHKALQSQGVNLVDFGKEIYQYKDRTFKLLTKDLADPETRLGDGVLVSILALFLAEMQRSAMGEWWAHFEGARQIIDLRGGLKFVSIQSPDLRSNLIYFML